ncbi:MAG: hypothetical protein IJ313_13280 [Clostridia bacterium]|nr:hypothetical protein [Clostridia bacterium]
MDRKKRIEYLAVTWAVFASMFALFFFLGTTSGSADFMTEEQFRWLSGLMGGYMFSSILSGIMLAARFFAKRKLAFKVVAALLAFFTFFVVYVVGLVTFIPYQIYNLVMIFRRRPVSMEGAGEDLPQLEAAEKSREPEA